MIFAPNLSREYETNICRLDYLSQESDNLYEALRDSFECTRKIGFPSIGSPVSKLKNEVLTLLYSVMQHQINCGVYEELLKDAAIDDADLWSQLSSLFEITNFLSVRYHDFLVKWELVKDQQNIRMITFSNIKKSIPA